MFEQIDINALPESMHQLSQEIGISAVIKLLERYQNQKLYVPNRSDRRHCLIDLIGQEAFESLVFHRGGLYIFFPVCRTALNKLRDDQIRQERSQSTLAELARKWGLTVTHLSSICRQPTLTSC